MKYLLDANTFIEANNRYYGMEICPAYWQWLLQAFENGDIFSINTVKEELVHYGDTLSDWVKLNSHIFLTESDVDTQAALAVVVQYVRELPDMKPGADAEFLSGADPWLIAKAMVTGATIITHEQFNPAIKRKVLIPNVCKNFGVGWQDTFGMLHESNARFVLPAA